jgi:predicted ArsR family transcriptional regulator
MTTKYHQEQAIYAALADSRMTIKELAEHLDVSQDAARAIAESLRLRKTLYRKKRPHAGPGRAPWEYGRTDQFEEPVSEHHEVVELLEQILNRHGVPEGPLLFRLGWLEGDVLRRSPSA